MQLSHPPQQAPQALFASPSIREYKYKLIPPTRASIAPVLCPLGMSENGTVSVPNQTDGSEEVLPVQNLQTPFPRPNKKLTLNSFHQKRISAQKSSHIPVPIPNPIISIFIHIVSIVLISVPIISILIPPSIHPPSLTASTQPPTQPPTPPPPPPTPPQTKAARRQC